MQALLEEDQVIGADLLAEVGKNGFAQVEFRDDALHRGDRLRTDRLLRQILLVLDPSMVERLLRRVPLINVLLDQALQELLRLR